MIISSGLSSGRKAPICSSTAEPAGTIKIIARGFFIVVTSSCKVSHGVILSESFPAILEKFFVIAVVRLNTEIRNPFSAIFKASIEPIVPSPIKPISDFFNLSFSKIIFTICA